jgi:hypothetical protein
MPNVVSLSHSSTPKIIITAALAHPLVGDRTSDTALEVPDTIPVLVTSLFLFTHIHDFTYKYPPVSSYLFILSQQSTFPFQVFIHGHAIITN